MTGGGGFVTVAQVSSVFMQVVEYCALSCNYVALSCVHYVV